LRVSSAFKIRIRGHEYKLSIRNRQLESANTRKAMNKLVFSY
jgi:hypothetical protein